MAEIAVERLTEAGFADLDSLREATDAELAEKLELTDARIADLRAAINFLSPVVDGEAVEAEEE